MVCYLLNYNRIKIVPSVPYLVSVTPTFRLESSAKILLSDIPKSKPTLTAYKFTTVDKGKLTIEVYVPRYVHMYVRRGNTIMMRCVRMVDSYDLNAT